MDYEFQASGTVPRGGTIVTDQKRDPKSDDSDDEPSPEQTLRLAKQWAVWATHDVANFIDPIVLVTGLSRSEVLLYIISERLAQIAESGVRVQLYAKHEIIEPGDETEDWKKE